MSCPTVTALVTSGICAKCDEHGSCKIEALVLEQIKDGLKLITVGEALEIYKAKARARNVSKDKFVMRVSTGMRILNLPMNTRLNDIGEIQIDRLVEEMRKDGASRYGTPYRDMTIRGHVAAMGVLNGDVMRKMYRGAGYDLMPKLEIDIDKYGFERPEVQHISIAKINALAEEMVVLKRGKKSDQSVYLFLFMAMYFQLSRIDILTARWENFKDTVSGKFYETKRHKTNVPISRRVLPEVWAKIAEFAKPEGFIIEPDPRGKKNEGGVRCMSVARRASEVCKRFSVGGEYLGQKTNHAIRKFGAQLIRAIFGLDASSRALSHSKEVDNRYYADAASEYHLVAS